MILDSRGTMKVLGAALLHCAAFAGCESAGSSVEDGYESLLAIEALPPNLKIERVSAEGPGCRPGTWAAKLSDDRESFAVRFSSFTLDADSAAPVENTACRIVLTLAAEEGMAYSPVTVGVLAAFDVQAADAQIATTVRWTGSSDSSQAIAVLNHDEDGVVSAGGVTHRLWSPCNGQRELIIDVAASARTRTTSEGAAKAHLEVQTVDDVRFLSRTCNDGDSGSRDSSAKEMDGAAATQVDGGTVSAEDRGALRDSGLDEKEAGGGVTITNVRTAGPGCSSGTPTTTIMNDGASFYLDFPNFSLAVDENASIDRKHCMVMFEVQAPSGKRYALEAIDGRGTLALADGVSATLTREVSFPTRGGRVVTKSNSVLGPLTSDFETFDRITGIDRIFSECGVRQTVLIRIAATLVNATPRAHGSLQLRSIQRPRFVLERCEKI